MPYAGNAMPFLKHFRSLSAPLGASMLAGALVLGTCAAAPGQALSHNENQALDPAKIVRDASYNELHSTKPGRSFSYRQHKVDPKGSIIKEIVETKDGDVARLIEKNGKPLPPEEEQAEIDRLNNLLAHPEVQEHRHK